MLDFNLIYILHFLIPSLILVFKHWWFAQCFNVLISMVLVPLAASIFHALVPAYHFCCALIRRVALVEGVSRIEVRGVLGGQEERLVRLGYLESAVDVADGFAFGKDVVLVLREGNACLRAVVGRCISLQAIASSSCVLS